MWDELDDINSVPDVETENQERDRDFERYDVVEFANKIKAKYKIKKKEKK